jgi:hypothetical protein
MVNSVRSGFISLRFMLKNSQSEERHAFGWTPIVWRKPLKMMDNYSCIK